MSDTEPETPAGPDDWEFETAFEGPAPMANRWFITTHNNTVRLGFCEQYNSGNAPHFRAAVTLDHHDALELGRALHNFMEKREADRLPAGATPVPSGFGALSGLVPADPLGLAVKPKKHGA